MEGLALASILNSSSLNPTDCTCTLKITNSAITATLITTNAEIILRFLLVFVTGSPWLFGHIFDDFKAPYSMHVMPKFKTSDRSFVTLSALSDPQFDLQLLFLDIPPGRVSVHQQIMFEYLASCSDF
jgi:hypothetical protein